jgi:hypothetical protein
MRMDQNLLVIVKWVFRRGIMVRFIGKIKQILPAGGQL